MKGVVYALHSTDLSILSTFDVGSPVFSSIAVSGVENVTFGCHDNNVYCVNANDVTLKWKVQHSNPGQVLTV